jgi:hypothetical protein
MAESTSDELLEWLQEHNGRSVYLEVGTDAPDTMQPASAFPVAMHVTLNGMQSATNLDRPDHMAVMVRLDGDDRNRLYLEPDRITKILIHGGVKVWFLERFYIALS